jgi:ABC-type uncharacterized transport system substrate-binding protein
MNATLHRKLFTTLACLFFLMGWAHTAQAHPHVWVDVVTDLLFDKKGRLTGLKHSWVFDESYSVLAVQGLDRNKDHKYSANELKPLLDRSINSLKDWEYFSYIEINNRNVPWASISDTNISYEKDKVHINFTLLIGSPVDTSREKVRFTVYDRSFYNLMSFTEEDPIWLGKHAPDSCSFIIEPAKRGDRETAYIEDDYIATLGDSINVGAQFAEWATLECAGQ